MISPTHPTLFNNVDEDANPLPVFLTEVSYTASIYYIEPHMPV